MSRIDILGIALGAVGVILSLPGFLLLFLNGQTVIAVLTLLLGVVILAAAVWRHRYLQQPSFTLLEVDATLSFEDKNAHKATHVDTRKVRANQKGLTEFWFRSIGSDGSIGNLLIDGKQPDFQQTQAGQTEIGKRFPDGLERGTVFKITASFETTDAFPGNREFYTHEVTNKTQKVRLRVKFHPQKPSTSARVYLQYGNQKHKLLKTPKLKRSEDGREIEFEVEKPRRGETYRIEWDW